MSLEVRRFGRVEFCISNICCCFLHAGTAEKIKTNRYLLKIGHVHIDELPRTQNTNFAKSQMTFFLIRGHTLIMLAHEGT